MDDTGSLAILGVALLLGVGVWLNGKVTVGESGPQPEPQTESQSETPLQAITGTEKYITLTVPVIMPDKAVETE